MARRYASIELRWTRWHIIVRLMRVYVEPREIVASLELERQYETAQQLPNIVSPNANHSLLLFVRSRAFFSIPCSIVSSNPAGNAHVCSRSRPRGKRRSRWTCTPSVRERDRRRRTAATVAATTVPRASGSLARHRFPDRASRTRRDSMAHRPNGGCRESPAAAWAIEIRLDHGTRRGATVLRGS